MTPKTLYEKIWESHVVHEEPGKPALIYIDRHLIHEGTSPQAFAGLKSDRRKVRRPDLTFAVMDHSVPTTDRTLPIIDQDAKLQFEALERMIESPRAINGTLSPDDVRVLPLLRSSAVVKGLRFPDKVRAYFETMMAAIGYQPLPTI